MKLKTRTILSLLLINSVASSIASLIAWPLAPALFGDANSELNDMFHLAIQGTLSFIIFAIFIIIGLKEITSPIDMISKAAQKITTGDFDVTPVEARHMDEIGKLTNNFNIMVKELQNSEYMQRDFIANVSHEFKTPLAVMAGYAGMLAQEDLPPEKRKHCSRAIAEEAARLSKMTSNILLLSKLDNQHIHPKFARFPLDEQLRQAVLNHEPRWQAKNISFTMEVMPIKLHGNEELLAHVWSNLLDNAIKYSDENSDILVRLETADNKINVSVADNGIGMNEETLTRVFDQFYQGDTSRAGQGNGLGLSIANRIVRLHNGRIEVASEPGKGSVFTAVFPTGLELEQA